MARLPAETRYVVGKMTSVVFTRMSTVAEHNNKEVLGQNCVIRGERRVGEIGGGREKKGRGERVEAGAAGRGW